MSKAKVRALILDYGGVLSRPQDVDSVKRMAEIVNRDYRDFCQVYRARRAPYDSGLVSGEEYWRGVLEQCGIQADDSYISRLIRYDVQSWTQINESMIQFVTEVRDRIHKLAIISNMTQESLVFLKRQFHWLELFDERVFSCEVGTNKPGRDIYELCLQKLELPAHECLFVDDSPENVQGALQVGMAAVRFQSTAQFLAELDRFCIAR